MAVAEATALGNLITKATAFAQQTALDWYRASEAMKLFPLRLEVLKQQSKTYKSLLNRYGMSADPAIGPVLEIATKLLDDEERKLQKLQQNCFCRVGRKLLFPESLVRALDSVITAFGTVPEMISREEQLTQRLERASLSRVACLLFNNDEKYVPLEASVAAVRRALESEKHSVVVVSGGPGQGKTSLARYLACLYQEGTDPLDTTQGGHGRTQGDQIAPGAKLFADGVFFLSCFETEDNKTPLSEKLLNQLWTDLGYQPLLSSANQDLRDQALPTSADQGQASEAHVMPFYSQSERQMLNQLNRRLANQMVLIIVDDVRDHMIMNKILVQQKGIKYLITTQFTRLWKDNNCVEIPISKPTLQEANKILANHVEIFPQEVTSDIQDQIDQIIEKSASNPLVLANVGASIPDGDATLLRTWQSINLRDLSNRQNGFDSRPVLFQRTYSKRTMEASMKMALNSFPKEEQTLLLLACVFEGQPVPEAVFETFFTIIHPGVATFSMCRRHMETTQFIQIESPADLRSDFPERNWSLHTMRKSFITMIKEKEIASLFSKLMKSVTNDDKLVAILLVLYGQETWRKQAAARLDIPANQLVSSRLSPIRTFASLLNADDHEEWRKKSHHCTKQILGEYVLSGELKEEKIIELLSMQETISSCCEALLKFTILNQKPLFKKNNDQILDALTTLLHKSITGSQIHLIKLLKLFQKLSFHNPADAIAIVSCRGAVEMLIGLLEERSQDIQSHTAFTLVCLSHNIDQNARKIGSNDDAVERLVGLLRAGVHPDVQSNAAFALGSLSMTVDIARKIGSHQGAVEGLVGLLGEGVNLAVQGKSASALAVLSAKKCRDYAARIGSCEGAIKGLVKLLETRAGPDIQSTAALTLGLLSSGVPDNASRIRSYPGAVERLAGFLGEEVNPDVQSNAAWTLGTLCENVVDDDTDIGSFDGVVDRLVKLLGEKDNPDVQSSAASALASLSRNSVRNAITIGSYGGVVERLADLLAEKIMPNVQSKAAWALGCLSVNVVANATQIVSYRPAVERLVRLLKESPSSSVQTNVAYALACLSKGVAEKVREIGSSPDVVVRLVELIGERVNPDVQFNAAFALGSLAAYVRDNATNIGSHPSAVERLVGLMGDGVNLDVKRSAIFALGSLAKDVKNSAHIGYYPRAVERLIGFLEEGVREDVQSIAIWTLGSLSINVVDNAVKIVSYGGVERLVGLLGGFSPNIQGHAAYALGKLSGHGIDYATKIGSYPGAVETLVGLLESVSPYVQNQAAWTLGSLSMNVMSNATKIGSGHGAIEGLVGLLREGRNTQHSAAQALWIICCAEETNKGLLRTALSHAQTAFDSLKVLTCSQKHQDWFLQYSSALVYEMANENTDNVEYLSSTAYEGKGDAKVSTGEYEKALEAYDKALKIEMVARILSKRCFVKAQLGYFPSALEDANAFIELGDDRAFGLQERGVLKRIMKDFDGALADLNEGLELDTDDYEKLKHRAMSNSCWFRMEPEKTQ